MARTFAFVVAAGFLGCSSAEPASSGGAGGAHAAGGAGGASASSSSGASSTSGAGGAADDDAPFAAKRAACAFKAGATASETFGPSIAGEKIPIDTFVLVVQENRSFDHYLSALPAAGQAGADVAEPNATNPDANGNPISRFHQPLNCVPDLKHSWNGMHMAYDGGKNDGFIKENDPSGTRSLGYYDQNDLVFYYGLAGTYGVGDHYFCPTLTQTGPNRLYLYGATSLGTITNVGQPPSFVSIFDSLNAAKLPWASYRNANYSYEQAIFPNQVAKFPQYFRSLTEFAADAAADKLPPVSFIYVGPDEHPPQDMQKGEVDVQKIFTELAASPAWSHAAFILTYDENGGFYDHVPPPPACAPDAIAPKLAAGDEPGGFDRYGFRVPFIVASAWSKPHFVSHTVHDHTSILRLLELRFGLGALTARDANANSLLEYFDFSTPHFAQPPSLPSATVDAAKSCP